MRRKWLPLLLLPVLTHCTAIGNAADSLGEHMPVIGERCEHWQCFTASGRAQSEANKQEMLKRQAAAKAQAAAHPAPASEQAPALSPAAYPAQPSH